ncbi:MAG TPA: hypothetical protein VKU00_15010 [Chthonomonadaceae bacterium]|nr:hypothetical protein [Chthonomonadaceae bacterium]
MAWLIGFIWPILAGFGMYWVAGKCRGRNAKNAFTLAAWGFWLLMLFYMPLGLFWPLSWIVALAPSAICFLLAANYLLKEMRAQKEGDYTERA